MRTLQSLTLIMENDMSAKLFEVLHKNANTAGACGAKTPAGTPCKRKDIYSSGRCKLHGGLPTWPVTSEGKHRLDILMIGGKRLLLTGNRL